MSVVQHFQIAAPPTPDAETLPAGDVPVGADAQLRDGEWRQVVATVRGDRGETIATFADAIGVELDELLRTRLQPGIGLRNDPYVCEEEWITVAADEILLLSSHPTWGDTEWIANRFPLDAAVPVKVGSRLVL